MCDIFPSKRFLICFQLQEEKDGVDQKPLTCQDAYVCKKLHYRNIFISEETIYKIQKCLQLPLFSLFFIWHASKHLGTSILHCRQFYHLHELSVLTSIEYLFLHSQSTGLDSSEVQTISVPKAIEVKYPVTKKQSRKLTMSFFANLSQRLK